MQQSLVMTETTNQYLFSLNMQNIDSLFPGFALGDFVFMYGSASINLLTSRLCVRAQFPSQLGGLFTDVVYIDGGNTFRPNDVSKLAQIHHINGKKVLEGVVLSRAFTAYQMTTFIMERLKTAVEKHNAKLVIISDIIDLFLYEEILFEEARNVFGQIVAYLQKFALQNQIILIVTSHSHQNNARYVLLEKLICGKANVVLALRKTLYDHEFELEKHPRFMLGTAEYPSNNATLAEFINLPK
jgi:hypothetical protein